MLAGVILGGAYLYKYFALQVSGKMLRTFWPFPSCILENWPKFVLSLHFLSMAFGQGGGPILKLCLKICT